MAAQPFARDASTTHTHTFVATGLASLDEVAAWLNSLNDATEPHTHDGYQWKCAVTQVLHFQVFERSQIDEKTKLYHPAYDVIALAEMVQGS